MIYLDNSATSLIKPDIVVHEMAEAMSNSTNANRASSAFSLKASRIIYNARSELAKLVKLENEMNIAFTSNATEALNLVLHSILEKEDHVITSLIEHNACLRPLYNIGVEISLIGIRDNKLNYSSIESEIKSNTKAIVINHVSNVTGMIIDLEIVKDIAKRNNILLIVDVSQSIGSIDVDVSGIDIMCFTGHKYLLAPQGTGGIIVNTLLELKKIVKTGGQGFNTFQKIHHLSMPDLFEVGTMNTPGIAGLAASVSYLNNLGIDKVQKHKSELVSSFYEAIEKIAEIKIYGNKIDSIKSGVVALNILDYPSSEVGEYLNDNYEIVTRVGFHCAPLIHQFYQTKKQGMVRFSFSYFNSINEVEVVVSALNNFISERKK